MQWTMLKIRKALGGKLIGRLRMRELVCQAILHLSPEMIERVCRGVWFISSQEDAWALTFRGEDLQKRHLVFLSDELLQEDDGQVIFTILHEIGHVLLHHRNSIGYQQTESEIRRQEEEANAFAKQYFSSKKRTEV